MPNESGNKRFDIWKPSMIKALGVFMVVSSMIGYQEWSDGAITKAIENFRQENPMHPQPKPTQQPPALDQFVKTTLPDSAST